MKEIKPAITPQDIVALHWILLLSILSLIIYIFIGLWKGKIKRESFSTFSSVFFHSASILGGIRLVIGTLYVNLQKADPKNFEDSDVIFTIIGGAYVAWYALWELKEYFENLYK